jgi:hypothetical protein
MQKKIEWYFDIFPVTMIFFCFVGIIFLPIGMVMYDILKSGSHIY